MHIENNWHDYIPDKEEEDVGKTSVKSIEPRIKRQKKQDFFLEEKELEEIFTRTYGQIKQSAVYNQSRLGYEKKPSGKVDLQDNKNEVNLKVKLKEYL